ncbi:hypothetical protein Agub_g5513, partial [Astrephomene gubernaculifera]
MRLQEAVTAPRAFAACGGPSSNPSPAQAPVYSALLPVPRPHQRLINALVERKLGVQVARSSAAAAPSLATSITDITGTAPELAAPDHLLSSHLDSSLPHPESRPRVSLQQPPLRRTTHVGSSSAGNSGGGSSNSSSPATSHRRVWTSRRNPPHPPSSPQPPHHHSSRAPSPHPPSHAGRLSGPQQLAHGGSSAAAAGAALAHVAATSRLVAAWSNGGGGGGGGGGVTSSGLRRRSRSLSSSVWDGRSSREGAMGGQHRERGPSLPPQQLPTQLPPPPPSVGYHHTTAFRTSPPPRQGPHAEEVQGFRQQGSLTPQRPWSPSPPPAWNAAAGHAGAGERAHVGVWAPNGGTGVSAFPGSSAVASDGSSYRTDVIGGNGVGFCDARGGGGGSVDMYGLINGCRGWRELLDLQRSMSGSLKPQHIPALMAAAVKILNGSDNSNNRYCSSRRRDISSSSSSTRNGGGLGGSMGADVRTSAAADASLNVSGDVDDDDDDNQVAEQLSYIWDLAVSALRLARSRELPPRSLSTALWAVAKLPADLPFPPQQHLLSSSPSPPPWFRGNLPPSSREPLLQQQPHQRFPLPSPQAQQHLQPPPHQPQQPQPQQHPLQLPSQHRPQQHQQPPPRDPRVGSERQRWALAMLQCCRPLLRSFPPRDLSQLLWAAATLDCCGPLPSGFLHEVVGAAELRLGAFEPQAISNMLWALARLRYRPPRPWLLAVCSASAPQLPLFSPQALANTAAALAAWELQPLQPEWREAFLAACLDMWRRTTAAEAAEVEVANVRHAAEPRRRMQQPAVPTHSIAATAWAVARLRLAPSADWVAALAEAAAATAPYMNGQDVANVMWALAALGYNPAAPAGAAATAAAPLPLAALLSAWLRCAPSMQPQQLSACMVAAAHMRLRVDVASPSPPPPPLSAAAAAAHADAASSGSSPPPALLLSPALLEATMQGLGGPRMTGVGGQAVGNCLWAAARLGWRPPGWWVAAAVGRFMECLEDDEEVGPQEVANVWWAMGRLRWAPAADVALELLSRTLGLAAARDLRSGELAMTLGGLARLGVKPPKELLDKLVSVTLRMGRAEAANVTGRESERLNQCDAAQPAAEGRAAAACVHSEQQGQLPQSQMSPQQPQQLSLHQNDEDGPQPHSNQAPDAAEAAEEVPSRPTGHPRRPTQTHGSLPPVPPETLVTLLRALAAMGATSQLSAVESALERSLRHLAESTAAVIASATGVATSNRTAGGASNGSSEPSSSADADTSAAPAAAVVAAAQTKAAAAARQVALMLHSAAALGCCLETWTSQPTSLAAATTARKGMGKRSASRNKRQRHNRGLAGAVVDAVRAVLPYANGPDLAIMLGALADMRASVPMSGLLVAALVRTTELCTTGALAAGGGGLPLVLCSMGRLLRVLRKREQREAAETGVGTLEQRLSQDEQGKVAKAAKESTAASGVVLERWSGLLQRPRIATIRSALLAALLQQLQAPVVRRTALTAEDVLQLVQGLAWCRLSPLPPSLLQLLVIAVVRHCNEMPYYSLACCLGQLLALGGEMDPRLARVLLRRMRTTAAATAAAVRRTNGAADATAVPVATDLLGEDDWDERLVCRCCGAVGSLVAVWVLRRRMGSARERG